MFVVMMAAVVVVCIFCIRWERERWLLDTANNENPKDSKNETQLVAIWRSRFGWQRQMIWVLSLFFFAHINTGSLLLVVHFYNKIHKS